MLKRLLVGILALAATAILLSGCVKSVAPTTAGIQDTPEVITRTDSVAAKDTAVAPTPISTPPGSLVGDRDPKLLKKPVLEEIAANYSYFDTVEELRLWLAEDDTNEWIFIDLSANQSIGAATGIDVYDCDDYALQLQRRALASGYVMSAVIVERNGSDHMINSCIIDRKIYYIEPQTDEIWLYSSLD